MSSCGTRGSSILLPSRLVLPIVLTFPYNVGRHSTDVLPPLLIPCLRSNLYCREIRAAEQPHVDALHADISKLTKDHAELDAAISRLKGGIEEQKSAIEHIKEEIVRAITVNSCETAKTLCFSIRCLCVALNDCTQRHGVFSAHVCTALACPPICPLSLEFPLAEVD